MHTESKSTAATLMVEFTVLTACDQLPGAAPKSNTVLDFYMTLYLSSISRSLKDALLLKLCCCAFLTN